MEGQKNGEGKERSDSNDVADEIQTTGSRDKYLSSQGVSMEKRMQTLHPHHVCLCLRHLELLTASDIYPVSVFQGKVGVKFPTHVMHATVNDS